jgi:hypothetical protein
VITVLRCKSGIGGLKSCLKEKKAKAQPEVHAFPLARNVFNRCCRWRVLAASSQPKIRYSHSRVQRVWQHRSSPRMHLCIYAARQGTPLKSYATIPIRVIGGGSCFSCILPSLLILASSAFSSAPKSMAKLVQYSHVIRAIAAPNVP